MGWNDERVEQLKTLWNEGLSASQVASRLGGVTRNAVISKVHRLNLATRVRAERSATARSVGRMPRLRVRLPEPPVPIRDPIRLDDGTFVTPLTLGEPMCRWPIGDPSEHAFHFCGHKRKPGSPYCDAHAHAAYQPARRSRTAAKRRVS
jgi:GcrA cell cycle regulator